MTSAATPTLAGVAFEATPIDTKLKAAPSAPRTKAHGSWLMAHGDGASRDRDQ